MMEEVGVSPSKARSSGILSAVWYDGGGWGVGGVRWGWVGVSGMPFQHEGVQGRDKGALGVGGRSGI